MVGVSERTGSQQLDAAPSIPAAAPERPLSVVLLPLRAFLGFTFLYAGISKFANPAFLSPTSSWPFSIHNQLLDSSTGYPLSFLVRHLVHASTAVGLVFAIGEVAVGIGVTLGLFTKVAAIGGIVLSLSLFLSVSFNAYPWFTGADIVYLFAFTPLLVGGAGGRFSLDGVLARQDATQPGTATARRAVLGGLVAVLGAVFTGAIAGLGRLHASAPTASGKPERLDVASAASVPVGSSLNVADAAGEPFLIIHLEDAFVAYSAVCPHLGCTVGYSQAAGLILCPCHGSEFNPQDGGLVRGPATHGLTTAPVADDAGRLYLTT